MRVLVATLLALLFLASLGRAEDDQHWRAIEMERRNVERLKEVINRHLQKIEETKSKASSLLEELEDLDYRIAKKQAMIDNISGQLEEQRQILSQKEIDLREAESAWREIRDHLENRLRGWYLMGEIDFIKVAFSSTSLPELLIFQDAYHTLLDYDKALIAVYNNSVTQLRLARDARQLEEVVLSRLVTRGTEITVEMTTLRQNRSTLLERVRTEQRLQERALKEMHMAKADLDRTLKTVQTKRGEAAKGFLQSKGKLSAPVAGEIIRSFGEKRIVDNHAFKETGIAIIAAHGAPIKAVYPGEVVFAGYERGFGNMVIIDHGMRQYTVTARLGKILVKEGDKVAAGSLIARAGDIASLLEDGVHFEIRDGSEPQDPLDWLDDSGLSFSP